MTSGGNGSKDRKVEQEGDDKAILDRFFSGDKEAVADLADLYAPRLYNFGMRMCGNQGDAEDLVQDTFVNVLRYLPGFRGETKLRNWLYRVASSVCIKKRRGKNRPDLELGLEDVLPKREDGPAPDIPDWSEMPDDNVLNLELGDQLKKAVSALPHKYRLVFNLRDIEGFSTEETADMLDITPQAVKTRLHRARAFLRNELAEYYREHRGTSEEARS